VPSCGGQKITVEEMLGNDAATIHAKEAQRLDLVAKCEAVGVKFVIGEGSSAVCDPDDPPVINTFSTALWGIDAFFNAASVGIDHFFLHSWGTLTSTFSVLVYGSKLNPNGVIIQPLYYAMRIFSKATAFNATMVQVNVTSTTSDNIKAYAAQSSEHFAVVILHKELKNTTDLVNVTLVVPTNSSQAPTATLHTLVGNVSAEFGITLDGQSYDGSIDGFPVGPGETEGIPGHPGGIYYFTMRPLSAVLFTFGEKKSSRRL